ncbi:MAG: phosphoglyceromutase [Bacteroidetes bacterium]|nr:phosphoglyceromutase [Bacteroidota bacterium]MBS1931038.1 phosphoglyceromutase [Bacteroidota bacterium]
MKKFSFILGILFTLCFANKSFTQSKIENLIIITTDGYRWQEVFKGMDSVIANNSKYNQGDSGYIFKTYWNDDVNERRKMLMPFLWNTIQAQGQIYGNREYNNNVDNANPYWFSYPGYNEIFTGYPDTAVNSNDYKPNPNTTVLEFLNHQPAFKGKVAAFGAWEAFDRILNEQRSGIPVFSAFDSVGGKHPTASEQLINTMRADSYKPWLEDECLDVFTHYEAIDYLKNKKPKVLYISYGETDEWAHSGKYRSYLDAAHQVDAWIQKIWYFIQSDPQYKNKTALFITVDHGRGDLKKNQWTDHGSDIPGAHEIWFAVLGPGIKNGGEIKEPMQVYQKQFAQTMAKLLGYTFKTDHPVGEEIKSVINNK